MGALSMLLALFLVCCFFLGASIASGVSCAIDRAKRKESWTKSTRSHCNACGHTLSAADLIPVIGYILLHGKCRYCGAKIPPNSFVSELITGTVFLAAGCALWLTVTM